jgi:hypothetical protein
MKQTAVEFLIEMFDLTSDLVIIDQAKEMEKQQIIDAVDRANKKWRSQQAEFILDGKQYYNETFKKK